MIQVGRDLWRSLVSKRGKHQKRAGCSWSSPQFWMSLWMDTPNQFGHTGLVCGHSHCMFLFPFVSLAFPLLQPESKPYISEKSLDFFSSVVQEDNTSISGIAGNSFISSFPAELLPAYCSCFLLSQVQDLVLVHAKLLEFPVVSFFQPLKTSLNVPSVLLLALLPLIQYHLAEYPHTI